MTTPSAWRHPRPIAATLLAAFTASATVGCGARTTPPPQAATTLTAAEGGTSPVVTNDPELSREPAPPRESAPEDRGASDHRAARVAGWISIAIGAQALTVGLVTSGMMLHENGIRSDECDDQKRCSQAGLDANANLRQLAGWNAGAYVVGGAGLAIGTLLLLLNPAEDRARPARRAERPTITVGAPGAPVGLGVGGSF